MMFCEKHLFLISYFFSFFFCCLDFPSYDICRESLCKNHYFQRKKQKKSRKKLRNPHFLLDFWPHFGAPFDDFFEEKAMQKKTWISEAQKWSSGPKKSTFGAAWSRKMMKIH